VGIKPIEREYIAAHRIAGEKADCCVLNFGPLDTKMLQIRDSVDIAVRNSESLCFPELIHDKHFEVIIRK
jgi:hypothetical protein